VWGQQAALSREATGEAGAGDKVLGWALKVAKQKMRRGYAVDAEAPCKLALDRTRKSGDQRREAEACLLLGRIERAKENWPGAEEWFESALAAQEGLSDTKAQAQTLLSWGTMAKYAGELDSAHTRLTSALGMTDFETERVSWCVIKGQIAEVLCRQGRHVEALAIIEEALTCSQGLLHDRGARIMRGIRIDILIEAGEIELAEGLLDRIEEGLSSRPDPLDSIFYEKRLGFILLCKGQEEGRRKVEAAATQLIRLGQAAYARDCERMLARHGGKAAAPPA